MLTNNENGNVQLYTYDVGNEFKRLYSKLTNEIRKSASWKSYIDYYTGNSDRFSSNPDLYEILIQEYMVKTWTEEFRFHLIRLQE